MNRTTYRDILSTDIHIFYNISKYNTEVCLPYINFLFLILLKSM